MCYSGLYDCTCADCGKEYRTTSDSAFDEVLLCDDCAICVKCGGVLYVMTGKHGDTLVCENTPLCDYERKLS